MGEEGEERGEGGGEVYLAWRAVTMSKCHAHRSYDHVASYLERRKSRQVEILIIFLWNLKYPILYTPPTPIIVWCAQQCVNARTIKGNSQHENLRPAPRTKSYFLRAHPAGTPSRVGPGRVGRFLRTFSKFSNFLPSKEEKLDITK